MSDPLTHFCNRAGDVTVGGACSVQNNPSVRLPQCLRSGSFFWRLSARNFGSFFFIICAISRFILHAKFRECVCFLHVLAETPFYFPRGRVH